MRYYGYARESPLVLIDVQTNWINTVLGAHPIKIFCDDLDQWNVRWLDRPMVHKLISIIRPNDWLAIPNNTIAFINETDMQLSLTSLKLIGCLVTRPRFEAHDFNTGELKQLRFDNGLPVSVTPPFGWRIVGPKDVMRCKFRMNKEERIICQELLEHTGDEEYISGLRLNHLHERSWSDKCIERAMEAARNGFPLPNGDRLREIK